MKPYFFPVHLPLALLLFFSGCGGDERNEGGSHTLGNGMEVILMENHGSPMVSSVVCVRAGSIYEDATNNGVSHLLEHLLFDGTGERTRIEIMEGIEDRGGYINATTRDDHTAYIILIPSEHVEYGLDVQADMLFRSIFPDSELVKERRVVIEEINKDNDNPHYIAEKFHRSHLYQETPLTRPVIGYKNIIASITREEIIRYYRERYVPENMVAFITGDFRSDEMLAMLERIFGAIPPGKSPGKVERIDLPRRTNNVYRLDSPADMSYVSISFDAPAPTDPDYFPFDYFVRTLSYHDGAPLMASLKGGTDPLVFSLTTDLSPHRSFSTFTITAITIPGREEAVIQTVLSVLKEESSKEADPEEMHGVMVDIKSNEYFLRERYHYYGMMKAPYIVSAGFDFIENYITRMEEVTPSLIQKVSERHFSRPRYVATVVGPTTGAKGEPAPVLHEETVRREVFDNGLRVVIREEKGSDIFAVHVIAANRAYLEPSGKSGMADFLSRMLIRRTKTRNEAEALSTDLAGIGARVTLVDDPFFPYDDYYTSPRYSFIRFESLGEYWREGLEILADIIRNPLFDSDDVKGVRREMLNLISQREERAYKTARRIYYETLFGDHAFSHPILGVPEDIEGIGIADLKWLHKVLYAPNNLIISVVSGIPVDSVLAAFDSHFSDMEPVEILVDIPRDTQPLRTLKKGRARMGKEQAYIYMGNILPGIEDEDVPAIRMMISILSERLAQELREKEGLAYSVGASAQFDRGVGWYTITMGTERRNYQRALDGIRRVINRLRSETIDEEELRKAINRERGNVLMKKLSSINRAYFLGLYEFLLDDYRESEVRLEELKDVRVDDVLRVARKYLHSHRGALATVK